MPLKYYIYTLSLKPMGLGGFEKLFGEEKFMLGHCSLLLPFLPFFAILFFAVLLL